MFPLFLYFSPWLIPLFCSCHWEKFLLLVFFPRVSLVFIFQYTMGYFWCWFVVLYCVYFFFCVCFGDIIEKYEITNNKGREHPNIQWGEMEENPADLNRQRWNDIKENKENKTHIEQQKESTQTTGPYTNAYTEEEVHT